MIFYITEKFAGYIQTCTFILKVSKNLSPLSDFSFCISFPPRHPHPPVRRLLITIQPASFSSSYLSGCLFASTLQPSHLPACLVMTFLYAFVGLFVLPRCPPLLFRSPVLTDRLPTEPQFSIFPTSLRLDSCI